MFDIEEQKEFQLGDIIHLETEPIFNIRIEFCDKSNPVEYFNLNLASAMDILREWSEEWILIPDEDSKLNGDWVWYANVRSNRRRKKKEPEEDLEDEEFTEPEE